MAKDEERRKLDKIMDSFIDKGIPEHMISLDMISAKIMELVKKAIGRMFMKKKKSITLKTVSIK